MVTGDEQLPSPAQVAGSLAVPELQLAVAHVVPAPGKPHAVALVPSQVPPQVVPKPAHAARAPTGGPEVTVEQVPIDPGWEHASRCPSQLRSQQTPSTHSPLAHCVPPVHTVPSVSSGMQLMELQKKPLAHSESIVQELAPHASPLQVNGEQSTVTSDPHVPSPWQLAASVAVLMVQLAERHSVPPLG